MLRRLAGPLLLVLALGMIGLGVLTLTETSGIRFDWGGGSLDPNAVESSRVGVDCGSALIPHSDDELCVEARADTQRTGLLQVGLGLALGGLSWLAFRHRGPREHDELEPRALDPALADT